MTDPPESPRLKLISSTATSLHISWEARPSDKVQGFIAHYKHGNGGFVEERLSRQLSSKLLSGLQCGTTYTVYLTAYNDVGHSEPSEFLEAATNGKRMLRDGGSHDRSIMIRVYFSYMNS